MTNGDVSAPPRPRGRVLAGIVVGTAIVVAFGIACAQSAVDFPIYHRVAAQILQGDFDFYPQPLDAQGTLPPHGFRYAPAIAFLFVPFGLLPLTMAAFVFFALKVAAYVYVGAVVARRAGLSHRQWTWMLTALVLVAGYTIEEFRYGNFHFFAVALMVLAFDRSESGAVAVPAAALALAIASKVMPILLLPYFAMRRRFALCAATIAAVAVLLVLPAAVVGFQRNNQLLDQFAKYAVQKVGEDDNYALRGVLVRYLTADHRTDPTYPPTSLASLSSASITGAWVVALFGVGLFVAAALRHETSSPAIRLLEFALVLTVMLIASPHAQRRYFTALFVPVGALVALAANNPRLDRQLVLGGLVVTAAASTVLPLVFGGRSAALAYEALSPYFFGTMALCVVVVVVTARAKRRLSISGMPDRQ